MQPEGHMPIHASDFSPALVCKAVQLANARAERAVDLIDGCALELTDDDRTEAHPRGLGDMEENQRLLLMHCVRISGRCPGWPPRSARWKKDFLASPERRGAPPASARRSARE